MSRKNYKIDEQCYGITSFKSNLVLACMSAIMFVDTKGNVLSKKTVTSCVDFISSVSHDRLCYTNHFQHFVHCMDVSNKDIFSYSHKELQCPNGVSSDEQCNIYIAGSTSNNIHQLSPDGQLLQILNPGISSPKGIAFKPNSNKFICSKREIKQYEMVLLS